jgi:signal transduction histidine kinase/ligand-binding sensor domain-containing protein/DNA-binding response OmpR family regulator
MQLKKWIISFLFLTGLYSLSSSQQIRYLSINDGLSSRQTYGIQQDYKGLLWFATSEGIDRYDGNEFRNYKLHSSTVNPSKLGYRFNVLCDTSGIIWAYTTSGKIFRYNQFNDRFELKVDLQEEIEINKTGLYVNTLFFDRANTLWIGTTTGTYNAKFSGSELGGLYFVGSLTSQSFVESDSGYIWEGTQEGVRILYPGDTIREESPANDSLYNATKDIRVSALFYDSRNKKLWIGSVNNGVFIYDFNENKRIDLSKSLPHVPVRSIVKDIHNSILIGFDGAGIRKFNADNYGLEGTWLNTGDKPYEISDNSVLDIFCDSEERIWVSTYTAGISIIDFQKPAMEFIKHQAGNENSIRSSNVYSILEDSEGNLWFGTGAGVSVLNRTTGRWDHLFNLKNTAEISEYKILALAEDDRGRIWIGGYGNGLHCYNKRSNQLTNYTNSAGTIYVASAYYDNDGQIWFGGTEGLLTSFDVTDDRITRYNIRNVTSTISKSTDQIWVGTTTGLFIVDKVSGKVIPYNEFTGVLKEISNTYINCLFQDKTGRLWIGTNGGGVNLYDSERGQISIISTENGLPSNYIKGISSDKNERIWITTEKGIGCFDPNTKSSINIGFIEGFTNFPFSRNAFVRLRSGDFLLGGFSGAIVITPEVIQPYTSKSRLLLNEFKISYQRVLPGEAGSPLKQPVDLTSDIILKHNQNSFSFNFSSINFDNTEQLAYQWKLDGFESEWSPLTFNNTAGYTNIPAGEYTFILRCYTQNNLVFDDERRINLSIRPPFWKTTIALIIYTILLSSLFWLIYSLEQNRLQKKNASDKIKFFINTTHDIKTPLSLIKAPLRNLETDKGITSQGLYYLHLAQSNAEKLARIVNQVLDFEKVDTNKYQLILTNNNLNSYLKEKITSYQILAIDRDIRFNFYIPDYEFNAVFDVDKMDKIIDNILSNAFKYTPGGGSIEFTVRVTEKEWFLEISDTGIGIPKKDRKNLFKMYYRAENAVNSKVSGTGIGLMLVQNLVRMHAGKISYTSQETKGSTFFISIPRKLVPESSISGSISSKVNEIPYEKVIMESEIPVSQIPEISKRQFKILIVEDDAELRNYLSFTLGKQFRITCAEGGVTALGLIQKDKFDLVISDVMMPDLRGDEFCRKIKTNFDTSHIPVILLTALSDKESTITGLEAGADIYIEKPFDIDLVIARINSILRNRQLISEYLLKGVFPNPDKVTINNLDKAFIKEILTIVERELANPEFSIDSLCRETAMSRTLLFNKIKVHTNLAPNEFIRIIRMNKAMDLLKSGKHAIGEIAEKVGFPDSKYFSTAFKKFFGKSPKNYLNITPDRDDSDYFES